MKNKFVDGASDTSTEMSGHRRRSSKRRIKQREEIGSEQGRKSAGRSSGASREGWGASTEEVSSEREVGHETVLTSRKFTRF
jgi:hypothetical protein